MEATGDSAASGDTAAPQDAGEEVTMSEATTVTEATAGSLTGELQDSIENRTEAINQDSAMAAADEDAPSEAETVLTSPVKKREVQKQQSAEAKAEDISVAQNISATATSDADDGEADAPGEVEDSGVADAVARLSVEAPEANGDIHDATAEQDAESESLSDISPTRSFPSEHASPHSREASEDADAPDDTMDEPVEAAPESPNPRKRKHRASSVGTYSTKRRSGNIATHKLRKTYTEDGEGRHPIDQSMSPNPQRHRRAVSTQSALMDGSSDLPSSRSRRSQTHHPVRDGNTKARTWDESSVSSEATSHGQIERSSRTRKGVGRSTSTVGKSTEHKHKRHLNKYGLTKVAELSEQGDLDALKDALEKDPGALDIPDHAGNTPLQIASLNGQADVVVYLISLNCRIDCVNDQNESPLIDAAENGHIDVVIILLEAGVNPTRPNRKGDLALDLVKDDTDNAEEIRATLLSATERWKIDGDKQRADEAEQHRYRAGPVNELHFKERTYENLTVYVERNDRSSVQEILAAGVRPDNATLAAAAKTGDEYIVSMLLSVMTDRAKAKKAERPLLSVLGTHRLEMIEFLTNLEQFDPLYRDKQGRGWPEIADFKGGPVRKQAVELLQGLVDKAEKANGISSPVGSGEATTASAIVESEEISEEEDDEAEEDEKPRRKGGKRRLMSRRDMLAANGKAGSESSSDEEGKERERVKSMKPPANPKVKRGVGRPRTKSMSGTPAETLNVKSRRRSSGVREKTEPNLPILEEQMEDADADADADGEIVPEAVDDKVTTPMDIDGDASNNVHLDSQHIGADERNAAIDEQLAAENKAEEDRRAAQTLEEQQAREAEAARLAEEVRMAAEEACMAAEAEAQAREAREAAHRKQREDLLAALPPAITCLHDQTLSVNDRELALAAVRASFTPLQYVEVTSTIDGLPVTEQYVLNIQGYPFLSDLENLDILLSPAAQLADADSQPQTWTSLPLDTWELSHLNAILRGAFLTTPVVLEDTPLPPIPEPNDHYHARITKKMNAQTAASKLLSEPQLPFESRWVKLSELRERLAIECKDVAITARVPWKHGGEFARGGLEVRDGLRAFMATKREHRHEAMDVDGKEDGQKRTKVMITHQK
ncbi:hypothetical protein B0A48_11546 [Cryoendolithus antarcticus]|uniref:Uncharacterized protein n=1 Tax=Cryoendolithus antarcticus TaxID=1507870 RepID=A0A1V8SW55_9PEZI|nr:hypothetical protein B0A48_11546 [Cryoendolithus antarcticus]